MWHVLPCGWPFAHTAHTVYGCSSVTLLTYLAFMMCPSACSHVQGGCKGQSRAGHLQCRLCAHHAASECTPCPASALAAAPGSHSAGAAGHAEEGQGDLQEAYTGRFCSLRRFCQDIACLVCKFGLYQRLCIQDEEGSWLHHTALLLPIALSVQTTCNSLPILI